MMKKIVKVSPSYMIEFIDELDQTRMFYVAFVKENANYNCFLTDILLSATESYKFPDQTIRCTEYIACCRINEYLEFFEPAQ